MSPPETIDPQTPVEALRVYLSNPLSLVLRDAARHISGDESPPVDRNGHISTKTRVLNMLASKFIQTDTMDPFFSILGDEQPEVLESLLNDPSIFKNSVENMASKIWLQCIHRLSRQAVSLPLAGVMSEVRGALSLREATLRSTQATLALIGILFILIVTLFRPKTTLPMNPGQISTTAIILANSHPSTEGIPNGFFSSEASLERMAECTKCRLKSSKQGSSTELEVRS